MSLTDRLFLNLVQKVENIWYRDKESNLKSPIDIYNNQRGYI